MRAFRLLGFAIGAAFAGSIANHVLYLSESPLDYKYFVVALLVAVLVICVGPLLVFAPLLHKTKKQGLFEYGTLANELGRQFEEKWLKPGRVVGEDALAATDFSATTDLYGIAANVREMETFPVGIKSLYPLVIATLLPFVPVALMAMPLEELLKTLSKLVL